MLRRDTSQWRSQGGGGGGFKLVHDSIKPQVWSRRFVTKFVWIQFGWVGCVPRFRCVHTRTVRARYACPRRQPAKLDSDKFDDSRQTKPFGLIESCTQGAGARPKNSGAASPHECSWALGPQTPLGLRRKPRIFRRHESG